MERVPPEKGKQTSEVVGLNQDFALFDPRRTISKESRYFPTTQFNSQIIFSSDILPYFPVYLSASPSYADKRRVLTPFNPELGYTVDYRDMQLETRREKIKQFKEAIIDFSQTPLSLHVGNRDKDELMRAGLVSEIRTNYYRFDEAILPAIRRLRFQLRFPRENGILSVEAKPDQTTMGLGELDFREFYPLDTGPLPAPQAREEQLSSNLREGFRLYVPSDLEKLQQIKGRFVFQPDRKVESTAEAFEE